MYSCSCQLVLPKHVVSGTMRLTALHVHFIGDVQQPPEEAGARSVLACPLSAHMSVSQCLSII